MMSKSSLSDFTLDALEKVTVDLLRRHAGGMGWPIPLHLGLLCCENWGCTHPCPVLIAQVPLTGMNG